jgi:hypothetical protein
LVLVNYLCLERALNLFKYKYPEVAGLKLWGSDPRRGDIHSSNIDIGGLDGSQLLQLGSGSDVPTHM